MESLRRGASRRDAAKGLGATAIKGHGWPLYTNPRRGDGGNEPYVPLHRSLAPSQYVAIQRIDFDTPSTVSLDILPSAPVAFSPEDAAVATVLSRVALHPASSRVCFAECYENQELGL